MRRSLILLENLAAVSVVDVARRFNAGLRVDLLVDLLPKLHN